MHTWEQSQPWRIALQEFSLKLTGPLSTGSLFQLKGSFFTQKSTAIYLKHTKNPVLFALKYAKNSFLLYVLHTRVLSYNNMIHMYWYDYIYFMIYALLPGIFSYLKVCVEVMSYLYHSPAPVHGVERADAMFSRKLFIAEDLPQSHISVVRRAISYTIRILVTAR